MFKNGVRLFGAKAFLQCIVPVLSEPSVLSPQSFLRKLRGEVLEKFQTQLTMQIGLRKVFQSVTGAVIRVYDDAGNMIETHEHKGDFKEW